MEVIGGFCIYGGILYKVLDFSGRECIRYWQYTVGSLNKKVEIFLSNEEMLSDKLLKIFSGKSGYDIKKFKTNQAMVILFRSYLKSLITKEKSIYEKIGYIYFEKNFRLESPKTNFGLPSEKSKFNITYLDRKTTELKDIISNRNYPELMLMVILHHSLLLGLIHNDFVNAKKIIVFEPKGESINADVINNYLGGILSVINAADDISTFKNNLCECNCLPRVITSGEYVASRMQKENLKLLFNYFKTGELGNEKEKIMGDIIFIPFGIYNYPNNLCWEVEIDENNLNQFSISYMQNYIQDFCSWIINNKTFIANKSRDYSRKEESFVQEMRFSCEIMCEFWKLFMNTDYEKLKSYIENYFSILEDKSTEVYELDDQVQNFMCGIRRYAMKFQDRLCNTIVDNKFVVKDKKQIETLIFVDDRKNKCYLHRKLINSILKQDPLYINQEYFMSYLESNNYTKVGTLKENGNSIRKSVVVNDAVIRVPVMDFPLSFLREEGI